MTVARPAIRPWRVVGASVGVAVASGDDDASGDSLIARAGQAMYVIEQSRIGARRAAGRRRAVVTGVDMVDAGHGPPNSAALGADVIEEILPGDARSAEAFDDLGPAPLFAEEAAQLERAVDKRRAEYATVRACARRALGELGLPPAALPSGERGAPRWPDGVVGSMTHCTGYRASAVAWATKVTTIGIDAEPALPLPDRVLGMVSLPRERERLAELAGTVPEVCWDRLLFCAKEAVYKAWFPLARRWLGFEDALIELDPGGTFGARLLVPGPRLADGVVAGFTGRWLARDGLLLAAVAGWAGG